MQTKYSTVRNYTAYYLVILLCCVSLNSQAQKEGNIWYFGNEAGLDFNSGQAVTINNSKMYQREGCAVISDSDGNVQFYTNGQQVWNSGGYLMGNGQTLMGDASSTQSAIISKQPGNNNLYYLFTVPNLVGTTGLRYTIIDMSLNGGAGDFSGSLNNTMHATPTEEKVTAVSHANGEDVWIITHLWDTDAFYAFLLTGTGLDVNQPVICNTGIIHQGGGDKIPGYMKASPDGSKLAIITRTNNSFQLFDFDNQTGIISNPITFLSQYPLGYGLEFSPNGKMLYISDYSTTKKVTQFDLTLPPAQMINSGIVVGTVSNTFIGALQVAPDRKIYISKFDATPSDPFIGDSYLGVINFPDERDLACGFVEDAIDLGTKKCLWGLPTFVQSIFFQLQNFTATTNCAYDTTHFTISNQTDLLGVKWDFGDPSSGIFNQSDVFEPSHVYNTGGNYNVMLISYFVANTDTIYRMVTVHPVPQLELGVDRDFCSNDPLILHAGDNSNTYEWQDGSTDSIFVVNNSGFYRVIVTNEFGCQTTDSVTLSMIESPVVELGNDTLLYVGETLTLQVNPGYTGYLWNTGDTLSNLTISAPGEYWVKVDNNGCRNSDSIVVYFESNCHMYCPTAFTPNGNGMNDAFTPVSNEVLSAYHLYISNRWGTIVFESTDTNITWDGTYQGSLVEIGVYVWTIEYKCLYSDVSEAKRGTVVVLR